MALPFGLDQQKPRHFSSMARIAWENRDQLPFAWRILKDGVCDGCALGTTGIKDWTLPGVHLCMVRLELLRLNTALRSLGIPAEFVHYPREGHGLREPRHRADAMQRALAWFDRWIP